MPERDPTRLAGRGCDHHLRRCDVGDPPGGGAQHERLARSHLIDHLLVQLADLLSVIEQVHGEESAVGDRATADDRQTLRTGPAPDLSLEPVPDDARTQLREFVRGIAPAQHVERRLQRARPEVAKGVGAMHQFREGGDRPLLHRRHRDDLLGKDVEWVARDTRRLDLAAQHAIDDDRGLEQIAAVLGEDGALRRFADRMAGAADPLDPAGDAGRRFHLDHEVDGAHIDTELEA